jgi:hypothetical protein
MKRKACCMWLCLLSMEIKGKRRDAHRSGHVTMRECLMRKTNRKKR